MFCMEKIISDIIETSIRYGSMIGANCCVFRDGRELFGGSFGFSDRENNVPMSRDRIFRLFSLTKPITSAAVMILFDRGLLTPETEVADIFPEYAQLRYLCSDGKVRDFDGRLSVIELLTMTSGIPYANNFNKSVCAAGKLFDMVEDSIKETGCGEVTTEQLCKKAAEIPLSFRAGERWDYGISADILGGIVERVSGVKYGDFLRRNIFEPLGMKDTGFYVPRDKRSRLAGLYSWQDGKLVRDHNNYLGLTDYSEPPAFESGGAGLVSTIDDYAKFACMLANRGELDGVRIMSERAFSYMTSPKLTETQRASMWDRLNGYNYGCLMRVMTDVEKSEIKTCNGEFGWDGWTGTYFCADAENRIAVLYFTQICGAGTTYEASKISTAVYDELTRK